jgi:hypothetical protein
MEIQEFGAHGEKLRYSLSSTRKGVPFASSKPSFFWPKSNDFRSLFRSVFLPEGYPNSVTEDYLRFQVWDTLQGVSSYLRGIICTQALLIGVGVGKQEASSTNAVVNWVFREGCGLFGGVLFAWLNARRFGADIKQWRLFADYINDVGLTLELLAPMFSDYFVYIAATGSICRAMCGVAAGATRAAMTQHFAKGSAAKVSDIASKEGIQENMVTLIGLIVGIYYAKWLDGSPFGTWATFIVLTIFHVYANYMAVTSLCLRTLNLQRFWINLQNFQKTNAVLNPKQVSFKERVFYWNPPVRLHLGVRIRDIPLEESRISSDLQTFWKDSNYAMWQIDGNEWYVVLTPSAKLQDLASALLSIVQHTDSTAKKRDSLYQTRAQEFVQLLQNAFWQTEDWCIPDHNYRCTWQSP